MYFLRWLYREVNPMILILGLVTLYFLLNLATCSKSTDSVVSNSSNAVKQNVAEVVGAEGSTEHTTSTGKQEIAEVASNTASNSSVQAEVVEVETDENVSVASNTEAKPVESALSKVFKDKPAENDLDADLTTEAGQTPRPSVLNRVFKRAEAPAEPEKDLDLESPESSKTTAAVVTGAAVATAGAVAAAGAEEESSAEVESEEKGGFFGLFSRSKDDDEEVTATADETEAEVAVAEEVDVAVAEEVEQQLEVQDNDAAEEAEIADDVVAVTDEVEVEQQAVYESPAKVAVAPLPVTAEESAEIVPPPPSSHASNISSNQDALSAARRAFWDRDYATADTLYSEMIDKEASNPELIAEYGNMLLQSGQVEKTLDAYEKAAGLMIDGGRKLEAKPLIDYISSWDQERADALINKVFAQ